MGMSLHDFIIYLYIVYMPLAISERCGDNGKNLAYHKSYFENCCYLSYSCAYPCSLHNYFKYCQ